MQEFVNYASQTVRYAKILMIAKFVKKDIINKEMGDVKYVIQSIVKSLKMDPVLLVTYKIV